MRDLRLQLARDLREVKQMFQRLRLEAFNRAGDPDMPGGDAMVMLGPGANLEAFNYRQISEIMGRTDHYSGADELDSDPLPPLMLLASWEDIIRDERDQPVWLVATINRSADYILDSIDWLEGENEHGEPNFMDLDLLADQIHAMRTRLENVLKDGVRLTRIKARCMYCDEAPRLARHYVPNQEDDTADFWFCPNKGCNHVYDADGVQRAQEHRLMVEGVESAWVALTDAAATSRRSVRTLRTWTKEDHRGDIAVRSRRHPIKDYVEVYWPDVREKTKKAATRMKTS